MNTQINPVRILVALAMCLLLLGTVALVVTGQLFQGIASAAGYLHANLDLLFGKRELRVSGHTVGSPPQVAFRISRLGLETSEKFYSCLTESLCAAYHRAYDAQVRKSIKREFGYDVLSELLTSRQSNISIVIQHE